MQRFLGRVLAFLMGEAPIVVGSTLELILVAGAIAVLSVVYVISVGYCFPDLRKNSFLFYSGLVFSLTAGYLVINEVCDHCMPAPAEIFRIASPPPTCAPRQHYDAARKDCVADLPAIVAPSQSGSDPPAKTCLLFQHYDAIRKECVRDRDLLDFVPPIVSPTCPLRQHYDAVRKECVADLPAIVAPSQHRSDPPATNCLLFQHYDAVRKECVWDLFDSGDIPDIVPPVPAPSNPPAATCPFLQHYDASRKGCVADLPITPTCPFLHYYDAARKECVAIHIPK